MSTMSAPLCCLCSDAPGTRAGVLSTGPVCVGCAGILANEDTQERQAALAHVMRPRTPFARAMSREEIATFDAVLRHPADVAAERIPEGRIVGKTAPRNPHDD